VARPSPAFPASLSAPSRREEILRAAAELFAQRGFHGVSMDDIGAAVGISGPALYRHFASKEAILAELLVGISEVLLDEAQARVATGGPPARLLAALVDWQVRFALDHPALITVHERDLASLPDDQRRRVRRLQRTYVEIWVDVLRSALPQGDLERSRAAVHAAIGLINSTPHSARLERPAMASLLRDMALGALQASAG
jgi:AcrR family transcriptional regulator